MPVPSLRWRMRYLNMMKSLKISALAICFVMAGFAPSGNHVMGTELPSVTILHMEEDILLYVNLDRHSHGLKPLSLNNTESNLALQHSKNMATGKTPFGHQGLESRTNTISKKVGPVEAAGENVAMGQMSAKEVVNDWLSSPGHKRNIEGDFILTGIGCVKNKTGMTYFTQIFTR